MGDIVDGPGAWQQKHHYHKWAMIAVKGGHCVVCRERVTDSNFRDFEFHHKIQLNNSTDKEDRWGGGVRNWPPFTEKWFAWADSVELVCSVRCHRAIERPIKQLSMFEFEAIQRRLDDHGADEIMPTRQASLF